MKNSVKIALFTATLTLTSCTTQKAESQVYVFNPNMGNNCRYEEIAYFPKIDGLSYTYQCGNGTMGATFGVFTRNYLRTQNNSTRDLETLDYLRYNYSTISEGNFTVQGVEIKILRNDPLIVH